MKLTKTVLAVAIAGIAATPMMASATTTLSGAVQLQISGSDNDDELVNENGEGGFDQGSARITTGDVIVGVVANQALNNGLTGYGSLRIDLDSFSGGDSQSADNVYVGVRGGFGDVRIGEVPNAGEYGQVTDIINDVGESIDQGISYTGSFGGATLGATYSPAPNQDMWGLGAKFTFAGFSVGAGVQDLDELTNFSLSAGFALAGASINVGFSSIEDGFQELAPAVIGADGVAADRVEIGDLEDEEAVTVTLGYSIIGVSVGLSIQSETESDDSVVRLDLGYNLGGGLNLSARVDANDSDNTDGEGNDDTEWRIQLSKSF